MWLKPMKFQVKITTLNGNSDSRLAHGASGIMIPIAIETNDKEIYKTI